jgi:hypothetical protein
LQSFLNSIADCSSKLVPSFSLNIASEHKVYYEEFKSNSSLIGSLVQKASRGDQNDCVKKSFKRNLVNYITDLVNEVSYATFDLRVKTNPIINEVVKEGDRKLMETPLAVLIELHYYNDQKDFFKRLRGSNQEELQNNQYKLSLLLSKKFKEYLVEYRYTERFFIDAENSIKAYYLKGENYFLMSRRYLNYLKKKKAEIRNVPDDSDLPGDFLLKEVKVLDKIRSKQISQNINLSLKNASDHLAYNSIHNLVDEEKSQYTNQADRNSSYYYDKYLVDNNSSMGDYLPCEMPQNNCLNTPFLNYIKPKTRAGHT